jgi:hypothetical protein
MTCCPGSSRLLSPATMLCRTAGPGPCSRPTWLPRVDRATLAPLLSASSGSRWGRAGVAHPDSSSSELPLYRPRSPRAARPRLDGPTEGRVPGRDGVGGWLEGDGCRWDTHEGHRKGRTVEVQAKPCLYKCLDRSDCREGDGCARRNTRMQWKIFINSFESKSTYSLSQAHGSFERAFPASGASPFSHLLRLPCHVPVSPTSACPLHPAVLRFSLSRAPGWRLPAADACPGLGSTCWIQRRLLSPFRMAPSPLAFTFRLQLPCPRSRPLPAGLLCFPLMCCLPLWPASSGGPRPSLERVQLLPLCVLLPRPPACLLSTAGWGRHGSLRLTGRPPRDAHPQTAHHLRHHSKLAVSPSLRPRDPPSMAAFNKVLARDLPPRGGGSGESMGLGCPYPPPPPRWLGSPCPPCP